MTVIPLPATNVWLDAVLTIFLGLMVMVILLGRLVTLVILRARQGVEERNDKTPAQK